MHMATMLEKQTSIRALQAGAIFASTSAGAAGVALSALIIPRLLESPTPLMLRQWANSFAVTKKVFPGIDGLAGVLYFALAYQFWGSTKSKLYVLAGGMCLSVFPYTLALVVPTNRKLFKKVEETKMLSATDEVVEPMKREETAKYLVDHWGILNLPRAVVVGAAGLVGLYASL